MENKNINDFVKASEHKVKIYNIINNKNLPENCYLYQSTDNSLINQLRTLTVELLIHPEWYMYFGNIKQILEKNCNNYTLHSINEIIKHF